jgi:hypothetical protein
MSDVPTPAPRRKPIAPTAHPAASGRLVPVFARPTWLPGLRRIISAQFDAGIRPERGAP